MNTILTQHRTNTQWSIVEAIVFQALLLIHQYALFSVAGHHFYGLIGVIFGGLYFFVKLIDFGFNKIIASFFLDYSAGKRTTYLFFTQELIPNACIYIILAIFFIQRIFPASFDIDTPIKIILLLLVLTESIKLNTKKILQLSHCFRTTALFEIGSIICYQLIVWSYYYYFGSLTASLIFGAFLVTSSVETIYFSVCAYRWYATLPDSCNSFPINKSLIIKNRLFAYCHGMSKQLFSTNTLVPLFAHSFGLESVALLKLTSYFIHSAIAVIERIIEPSSAVLFAHIKNDVPERKQHFFSYASSSLHTMLFCLFIFIAINCTKLTYFSPTANFSVLASIMVYFAIHFIESFFIVIEKFYIAHNRSEFLLINTIGNALLALVICVYSVSPLISLLCLCIARILSFCMSLFILSLFWKIRHSFTVHPSYLIGTLIASIVFFIIF